MASTRSMRGADVKVYINGQVYSPVTGIRWSSSTGRHAIYGIDQATPFELATADASVKGTVDVIRIRNSGGLEKAGIAAPEQKLLLEKYFSITVVDRITDTVILQIDEAAISDQNWQAVSKGIISGSFSFEGIGWTNEADL